MNASSTHHANFLTLPVRTAQGQAAADFALLKNKRPNKYKRLMNSLLNKDFFKRHVFLSGTSILAEASLIQLPVLLEKFRAAQVPVAGNPVLLKNKIKRSTKSTVINNCLLIEDNSKRLTNCFLSYDLFKKHVFMSDTGRLNVASLANLPVLAQEYQSDFLSNKPFNGGAYSFNLLELVCLDKTINMNDKGKLIQCLTGLNLSIPQESTIRQAVQDYRFSYDSSYDSSYGSSFSSNGFNMYGFDRDGFNRNGFNEYDVNRYGFNKTDYINTNILRRASQGDFFDELWKVLEESVRPSELILCMMQNGISFPDFALSEILGYVCVGTRRSLDKLFPGFFIDESSFTRLDEEILGEILQLAMRHGDFEGVGRLHGDCFYSKPLHAVRMILLADIEVNSLAQHDQENPIYKSIEEIKAKSFSEITQFISQACESVLPINRCRQLIADYVFTIEGYYRFGIEGCTYATLNLKRSLGRILFNMRRIMAAAHPLPCVQADEKNEGEGRIQIVNPQFPREIPAWLSVLTQDFKAVLLKTSLKDLHQLQLFIDRELNATNAPGMDVAKIFFRKLLNEILMDASIFEKRKVALVQFMFDVINACSARSRIEFESIIKNVSCITTEELFVLMDIKMVSFAKALLIIHGQHKDVQDLWRQTAAFFRYLIIENRRFNIPVDGLIEKFDGHFKSYGIYFSHNEMSIFYCLLSKLMAFVGAKRFLKENVDKDGAADGGNLRRKEMETVKAALLNTQKCLERMYFAGKNLRLEMMPLAYRRTAQLTGVALQDSLLYPQELTEIIVNYVFHNEPFFVPSVDSTTVENSEYNIEDSLVLYDACLEQEETDKALLSQREKEVIRQVQEIDLKKAYSDFELSFHFGVVHHIGERAKGVFHYNFNAPPEDLSVLIEGDYLIVCLSNPLTNKIRACVIVKKNPHVDGGLLKYDKISRSFEYFDFTRFALGINEASNIQEMSSKANVEYRFVQLGRDVCTENVHQYIYPTPTQGASFSKYADKKFYQESQIKSFCGYHAVNAFYGARVCSLNNYVHSVFLFNQAQLKMSLGDLQKANGNFSPLESVDPGALQGLLKYLSQKKELPVEYQRIQAEALSKVDIDKLAEHPDWRLLSQKLNHVSVDRVIVGWGAQHFLTLRKRKEKSRHSKEVWHVVDSMNPNSQNQVYNSIENCLIGYNHFAHHKNPTHFSFLYVPANAL